jgi:hypothetical protein
MSYRDAWVTFRTIWFYYEKINLKMKRNFLEDVLRWH